MPDYTLEITLLSDTAFGMGAGVAGLVDSEIQHDELGLPTLSGRAIKGLLATACSTILYALNQNQKSRWTQVASRLFGVHGILLDTQTKLHIGNATIAPDLRANLAYEFQKQPTISRQEIIDSLTALRRQTAMNEFGAPKDNTLRSIRVLLHGITLYAPVHFFTPPTDDEKALLAACVMGVKRAGLGRNRGKGKIQMTLTGRPLSPQEFSKAGDRDKDAIQSKWFRLFEKAVKEEPVG